MNGLVSNKVHLLFLVNKDFVIKKIFFDLTFTQKSVYFQTKRKTFFSRRKSLDYKIGQLKRQTQCFSILINTLLKCFRFRQKKKTTIKAEDNS